MRLRLVLATSIAAGSILAGGGHASAGGGGCHDVGPFTPVAATSVAMTNMCFDPGVVAIEPGDTLEITNGDKLLHNLYGPGWYEGDLAPGATASRRFDEAGTYTFACTLHPGMTGAVVVSDAEPIAATSPLGGGGEADDGIALGVVAGIGLALLLGLGSGWGLGWLTRRPAPTPATPPPASQ